MSIELRVFLLVGIAIYLGIIISLLKKRKLNLKYTLIWLFAAVVMLVATLFPQIVGEVANFVGVETPSNFVFVLEGLFVLMILLSLTTIVSHNNDRIYRLVQTQAILEKRVRELEEELEAYGINKIDTVQAACTKETSEESL